MGCLWRLFTRLVSLVVIAIVALAIWSWFSPVPGSFVIKTVFEQGTKPVEQRIADQDPADVADMTDISYRPGHSSSTLDIYYPDTLKPDDALTTIVWTHGGAWISGYKTDYSTYYRMIANEGYTVVSLTYPLAPGSTYSAPVIAVNIALDFLVTNADLYHINPNRIVLGGDSAGAQISSQIATAVTNPDYANQIGIEPSLTPGQLRGIILFCGIYDMTTFKENSELAAGILHWGTGTVLWAYTGEKGGDPVALAQMSTLNFVTADSPPTFITGGNDDPLTETQSKPLATALQDLGVPVTSIFFPADHPVDLGHEYQFDVSKPDATATFNELITWLDSL